jgi:hypothetical protein
LIFCHATAVAQGGVLALALAPLAFAAGMNPNFRVAPFSAVLVLLLSGQLGESPIESAFTRFSEVAIGTLGMEGAFEAMWTGEVDYNWAKEHHDLWLEQLTKDRIARHQKLPSATPAE